MSDDGDSANSVVLRNSKVLSVLVLVLLLYPCVIGWMEDCG